MSTWKRKWHRAWKRYFLMRFLAGGAMLWTLSLVTERAWPDKVRTTGGAVRYGLCVLFVVMFLGWLIIWERATLATLRRKRLQ